MLGKDNPVTKLAAFTNQLKPHLPPVDTVDGTLKTKNNALGTFQVSFGTTFEGSEWAVACEKGTVSISGNKVTVNGETKEVPDERTGVPPEVRAWGEALAAGKPNPAQSPEEALADLEILEKLLKSGEADGAPLELVHQVL